jgi:iron complex transport system ATP-binding protein
MIYFLSFATCYEIFSIHKSFFQVTTGIAFIARALAQNPSLFLFDESTSALDIRYQIGVMETMRRITREQGASMVIAVHDLNLAYRYADTVLVLDQGRVAGYGEPHAVLTPDCIRKVYGVESFVVENEHGKFIVPYRGNEMGP